MKLTIPTAPAVFLTFAFCGTMPALGQVEPFPLDSSGFYETTWETYGCGEHLCFSGCFVHRCPYCSDPLWYVQVDALFLDRTRTRQIKLVEQQDATPVVPRGQRPAMFTTSDLPFDYEVGPRITVGRCLDANRGIAVTYFGLHHWQSTATLASTATPANLSFPFNSDTISDAGGTYYNISNFDGATDVVISYRSQLHSVEVNYLTNYDWAVTRLIGLRFLNLAESFDYRSTDNGQTSDYLVDTRNNLIGFQLGGIHSRQVTERFSWDFEINAGLYANIAQQRTWLADVNNTRLLRDHVTNQGELAFIGEFRLGIIHQLSRCWAVTAGYQLTWIEGVALAPEQLDTNTTPTSGQALHHDGNVFYNGGYVGIGASY